MLLQRSPVIFFFLRVAEGVCYGAVTSLIPFLITRRGLSVTLAGSVTAIAVPPYVMAAAPRTSTIFSFRILLYALSQGIAYAAFSALVLRVVAQSATKYALLVSHGFAHDRWVRTAC